jgi:hypothetical protein
MMFGRKKIKSLEQDVENLCDIIDAQEEDIRKLIMEPTSRETVKVRLLYKCFFEGMKSHKTKTNGRDKVNVQRKD